MANKYWWRIEEHQINIFSPFYHITRLFWCVLLGKHTPENLYVTGGRPIHTLKGPFGKTYLEEHVCSRCQVTYVKRIRAKPKIDIGHR